MAITFTGFLNFAIPAAVIIFFAFIVLDKFKDPFIRFFYWIGGMFGRGKDKVVESAQNKVPDLRGANITYG